MRWKPPPRRDDGIPLRSHRVALQLPVRCHLIGEGWCEGWTENISRTGALIRAPHPAPLGAEVDIILTLPFGIVAELAGEIICSGSVVRIVGGVDGGPPGFGVMFRSCRPTVAGRSS